MSPSKYSRILSIVVSVVTCIVFSTATIASAKGKRTKRRAAASQPLSKESATQLQGDFRFGMTSAQVSKAVEKQIHSRYKDKIGLTRDIYQQDKLRRARAKEGKRFADTKTLFTGKRTGWDVSIIDDQFRHNTGESMMVYWENQDGKNQRRFFFFHNDRLYKMFVALNMKSLEDKPFSFFQSLMTRRYGNPAKTGSKFALWQGAGILLRAVNKLSFYGTFCLEIVSKRLFREVAASRKANPVKKKKQNGIMKSIVEDGDDAPSLDDGADAIDRVLQ